MRTGTEAPTSQPAYDELVSRERQPITPPTIILRTPAPTDDLDAERACLSPDELHHANTLRDGETHRMFVARRALLRTELAARLGGSPAEIVIDHRPCVQCGGPHGRPYPRAADLHFSVTSVRGPRPVVALALAERPVGFDLEEVAELDVVRDVATQLHLRERAAVTAALETSSRAACSVFAEIWTRKEALLKGTGEGITVPLDRDDVSDVRARPIPGWTVAMWETDRPDVVGAWALSD